MNPHFPVDAGTFYTGQNTQVGWKPGGFCGKDFEDNEQTSNFGVPTTEEAERVVVELFKNHKKKI